ncbi:MAG: hypothetical protein PWR10_2059 [Halanaerobiales bacterium]|nr:hypothetical protein [Halanaerobiales bacterium]
MSTILLIIVTLSALAFSFFKDRSKTLRSMKMAKGMFFKTGKDIIGVLFLIGLILAMLPESLIQTLFGNSNHFLSGLYGAIIGTITIIPAFIAFPLSKTLVESGANLVAVAAFITTLTMVGFATLPIEIEYFGKRFAFVRNVLSFLFALVIAGGMVIIL